MAIQGPGTPLRIGQEFVWKGRDKTNGWLMRSADGRIPALKEGYSRIDVDASSVLSVAGAVPYGNGLWRDMSKFDVGPGVVSASAVPAASCVLIGVAEFNQGWQTGHPVQNWGVPTYGRADMIRAGYVGYKVCMALGASASDYLGYLQGDRTKDIPAVRTVYADWAGWVATGTGVSGQTGRVLSVAFDNVSGFPIMVLWNGTTFPTIATATKAGDVIISENENEGVFIDFKASFRQGAR